MCNGARSARGCRPPIRSRDPDTSLRQKGTCSSSPACALGRCCSHQHIAGKHSSNGQGETGQAPDKIRAAQQPPAIQQLARCHEQAAVRAADVRPRGPRPPPAHGSFDGAGWPPVRPRGRRRDGAGGGLGPTGTERFRLFQSCRAEIGAIGSEVCSTLRERPPSANFAVYCKRLSDSQLRTAASLDVSRLAGLAADGSRSPPLVVTRLPFPTTRSPVAAVQTPLCRRVCRHRIACGCRGGACRDRGCGAGAGSCPFRPHRPLPLLQARLTLVSWLWAWRPCGLPAQCARRSRLGAAEL